jgi:hypothetical protein
MNSDPINPRSTENPPNPVVDRHDRDPASLPRCGAKTRDGAPCGRVGSARNGRCDFHGGLAGAPPGPRNGNYRHGNETKAAMAQRRAIAELLRRAEALLGGRT